MSQPDNFACPLCGQEHRSIRLGPGEKARCVRCDTVLAEGLRLGPDATLAFALTGLALALPAVLLPFVGADKLGAERISRLFTGVGGLWDARMRALALLVLLCGWLLPCLFLGVLTVIQFTARGQSAAAVPPFLLRAARTLAHWAIPEVQVLAVLVALMKLGDVVHMSIGPGFWCYCAMALALLIAQHRFSLDAAFPS